MSIAENIVASVVDDVTLSNLIGDRIYPGKLPATPVLPAMTYILVSQPQDITQDGTPLADARWRFGIWTDTYIELDPIAAALTALFNARHDGPFYSAVVENAFQDHDVKTGRWRHVVDIIGTMPI